jgi:hypothetical protein
MLQVSWLNYFIHYQALSNTFKINSMHCNMYSKWRISKDFKCRGSNLPHHYLNSGHLLELRYILYHLSFSGHAFRLILMFFHRCKFSILRCLVNHKWTSSTACREVVVPTPTTQTMTMLLDVFRFVAFWIVIGCTLWYHSWYDYVMWILGIYMLCENLRLRQCEF